eukprot:1348362-Rhodomonas_salina.1
MAGARGGGPERAERAAGPAPHRPAPPYARSVPDIGDRSVPDIVYRDKGYARSVPDIASGGIGDALGQYRTSHRGCVGG